VSRQPENLEALKDKQRSLKWEYVALLKESESRPNSAEIAAKLSRLRDELDALEKALHNFKR
jgi:hypothetical protein